MLIKAPLLQLYTEANPFSPIAWFRTAHRRIVDGVEVQEPPILSLQPEAEAIQEYVMGSLLLVEQKYRMKSQRASNMGPRMMTLVSPIGSLAGGGKQS